MVVPAPEGTDNATVPQARQDELCLDDDAVLTLAGLALQAEALFGGQPQDIEWVVAEGKCWLVQSRPITNLPTPAAEVVWRPPPGAGRLVRRQVVENMPGPLSPLFEELYLSEGLDLGMERLMREMGLNLDLDNVVERPLFVTSNGYGYCRIDIKFGWRTLGFIPQVLYFYIARAPALVRRLVPIWRDTGLAAYQAEITRWRAIDTQTTDDASLLAGIRALALADAAYWFYTTTMVGGAKITEALLGWTLRARRLKGELTTGMFLAGFASKTMAGEQALESIAKRIREDDSLRCPGARYTRRQAPGRAGSAPGGCAGALRNPPLPRSVRPSGIRPGLCRAHADGRARAGAHEPQSAGAVATFFRGAPGSADRAAGR